MFIKDSNTNDREFRLIGDLFDFAYLRESIKLLGQKNKKYTNIILLLNRGLSYSIENKIYVHSNVPNIDENALKEKDLDHPYVTYYSLSIPVYLSYYISVALNKNIESLKEEKLKYNFESLKIPCKSFIFAFYEYVKEKIGEEKAQYLLDKNINIDNLEEHQLLAEGNVNSLYEEVYNDRI